MSDQDHGEQLALLNRYRLLHEETSDPLASKLVEDIIRELESDADPAGRSQGALDRRKLQHGGR